MFIPTINLIYWTLISLLLTQEYSVNDDEIEDIMAGVHVNLNQNNELEPDLGHPVGVDGGLQGDNMINLNLPVQPENHHNGLLEDTVANSTVPTGNAQELSSEQQHNLQSNSPGGFVGPSLIHINAFIPQSDGAGDAFWEDLINSTENTFMECTEELSDINSDDSNLSVHIDYSLNNDPQPLDQEQYIIRMDIDQVAEGSSLIIPDIPFASSLVSTEDAEHVFMANFRVSLLGHVYTSKDFMNIILFQDLLGVQDWAALWPMMVKSVDRVLGRWAYYLQNFFVLDNSTTSMEIDYCNDMEVILYNVWDDQI